MKRRRFTRKQLIAFVLMMVAGSTQADISVLGPEINRPARVQITVCPTEREARDVLDAMAAGGTAAARAVVLANDCAPFTGVARFTAVLGRIVDADGDTVLLARGELQYRGNTYAFWSVTGLPISGVYEA